jgi:hypothetical protein
LTRVRRRFAAPRFPFSEIPILEFIMPEFGTKKPAEAYRPVPILTDIYGTSAPDLDAEEVRRVAGI